MKYFLHYENGICIGSSNGEITGDFETVEVSEQEYNEFLKQKDLEILTYKSIEKKQIRLNELTQDFIQASLGAVFDDIEERKREFRTLHNELRVFQGKKPREYK